MGKKMINEEYKAHELADKATLCGAYEASHTDVRNACMKMAKWKDKQFVKELRKVLEFSASPVDMEDEINNLIQKYENQ